MRFKCCLYRKYCSEWPTHEQKLVIQIWMIHVQACFYIYLAFHVYFSIVWPIDNKFFAYWFSHHVCIYRVPCSFSNQNLYDYHNTVNIINQPDHHHYHINIFLSSLSYQTSIIFPGRFYLFFSHRRKYHLLYISFYERFPYFLCFKTTEKMRNSISYILLDYPSTVH